MKALDYLDAGQVAMLKRRDAAHKQYVAQKKAVAVGAEA